MRPEADPPVIAFQLAQENYGLRRERYDVGKLHLHALVGNAPLGSLQVDLRPPAAAHLNGAQHGQQQKPYSYRGGPVRPDLLHRPEEGADFDLGPR